MDKIDNITTYSKNDGIHSWIFNTTKSNLFGFERNENLSLEIRDWEKHKHFVNKYGLMFMYPEDYLSIYILISLLKNFRILFHPDEQEKDSTIDKLNLGFLEARWLYDEEIHYDSENNYSIVSQNFHTNVFQENSNNRGLMQAIYNLVVKSNPKSRIYELSNSFQVHQAVICGGNGDVYKCPNYIGVNTQDEIDKIIEILSSNKKPNLNKILDACQFFILDYKGEDLGYARQLKIYSKKDISTRINEMCVRFSQFQQELKLLNQNCASLKGYEMELGKIEIKYGC